MLSKLILEIFARYDQKIRNLNSYIGIFHQKLILYVKLGSCQVKQLIQVVQAVDTN